MVVSGAYYNPFTPDGVTLEVVGENDGVRLNPSKLHSATMTTPISSHATPTTDTKPATTTKKGETQFSILLFFFSCSKCK